MGCGLVRLDMEKATSSQISIVHYKAKKQQNMVIYTAGTDSSSWSLLPN